MRVITEVDMDKDKEFNNFIDCLEKGEIPRDTPSFISLLIRVMTALGLNFFNFERTFEANGRVFDVDITIRDITDENDDEDDNDGTI